MPKKLLKLSEDEQSILDEQGTVVYVAKKSPDGSIYYDKPMTVQDTARHCIGWDDVEVCVKWGPVSGCTKFKFIRVCVEWG